MADVFNFYVRDNRKINFEIAEPIMREDSGVTDFRFHIPKTINGLDMSDWSWWFVFVNAKKEKYSVALTLSDDPESPLEFNIATYTVNYAMSIKAGAVQFALEAINAGTGGAIDNEWHTLTYETKVKETLQGNQTEYAETESDIISALIQEVRTKMNQIIGGATPTPVASISAMTDTSKLYVLTTDGEWYYYNGSAWASGGVYGAGVVDSAPTQGSTNAVSSGGVYEEISTINDDLESISDEIDDANSALSVLQDTVANMNGVPTAVRNALCVLCKKAVYTETGLLDELAVIESWASDITAITLNHTEATLNDETLQLIAVTVPEGGTITWQSNNTSVATVSSSGLVTPVSNGSVNIVAISGNAIATCSITVTGMKSLTGITATYTQSKTVYYTDSLAALTSDLVVVATYDDSTSRTLSSNEYVLSGTLVEGTSTITVTYVGYTATFSVVVTGNYTQYTKIIATGAQYINTGLSETDLDGCSFEYKVNPTHSTGSSGHLFSTSNNFVAFPQVRGATALNHIIFAKLKGTERTSADNIWTEGTDITVVAYADSNNSVSMNGTTVIESVPAGSTTPSASNYYAMFAYGGGVGSSSYRFKGALYYFKIYNSGGTLIHHYVPVLENSTGIAGLRDLITDTFYSSATSTAFTVE